MTETQTEAADYALNIAKEAFTLASSILAERDGRIAEFFSAACRAAALASRDDVSEEVERIANENIVLRDQLAQAQAELALLKARTGTPA